MTFAKLPQKSAPPGGGVGQFSVIDAGALDPNEFRPVTEYVTAAGTGLVTWQVFAAGDGQLTQTYEAADCVHVAVNVAVLPA